ncbi:MAG: hypothetical protein PHZ09_01890 [Eubacteriales bacterium]|nr:hypothetical protein [Eubacteriales bacterium]
MKFILKLFILAISLCMLTAVYTSCEKQNGDNTETSASTDESPASIETRQFFTDYYNETNNKNFSVITDYFAEDEETLQSKIDNFTFMATMFDVKYEIDSVEAMYLEDGNISVSLITLITSENKDSGSVTVMKEPSSYLLEKKDNKLMIISYAVGESEVVSMN